MRKLWVSLGLIWGTLVPWSAPGPTHAASTSDSFSLGVTLDGPPADVTDLVAAPGSADGVITLTWTEPGDHGYSGIASSYTVRVSTLGNIESDADFDDPALALPLSAFSLSPPPLPVGGGMLRTITITGLAPCVTYYFALKVTDDDSPAANTTSWSRSLALGRNATNYAQAADLVPAAPVGLTAVSGSQSVALSWTANTEADIAYYRIYRDSAAPADSFVAYSTTSATSFVDGSLTLLNAYFYRIAAVDTGPCVKESPLTDWVTGYATGRKPMEPVVWLASDTLRWYPVRRYRDGELFVDPAAPTPGELSGYRVYRATQPSGVTWQDMSAGLSTNTLSWTMSPVSGYYRVRAENDGGYSDSLIWDAESRRAHILFPDDRSFMEVSEECFLPGFIGGTAEDSFVIRTATGVPSGPRTLKSVRMDALLGGVALQQVAGMPCMGELQLYYHSDMAGGILPAAGDPTQVSVYWHNGSAWVQLYGRLDDLIGTMSLETRYSGLYELRSVERAGGFSFDAASLTNRLLTPNGDGRNDSAVWIYSNPGGSRVTGRIFDIKGSEVAVMMPGPVSDSLMWNGTSGGRAVPGGVYLYVLEAEGKTFNGTVVVIK